MIKDIDGKEVKVGDWIEVIKINQSALNDLPENESSLVTSMIGEKFEVYEIDSYGQAWVEKEWHLADNELITHSLGLSDSEIKLVKSMSS